jgi:hypothetical protein
MACHELIDVRDGRDERDGRMTARHISIEGVERRPTGEAAIAQE